MRDEQRDVQSRVMSDISVFLSVEQEQTAAAFRELHIFIMFLLYLTRFMFLCGFRICLTRTQNSSGASQ